MKKDIRDYKNVGIQYAYILDSIEQETSVVLTGKEKVVYFFNCFDKEYNYDYNKCSYPNLQERITSYLRGLPSCIGIAFIDYNIAEIGKLWGYCKTDKQAAKFVDNWFDTIAFRLIQLAKYYDINILKQES